MARKLGCGCLGLISVFVLLVIIGSMAGAPSSPANQKTAGMGTSRTPTSKSVIKHKELPAYQKSGKTWKNIVIEPGMPKADLIALAIDIHKKDPQGYYRIFDDDGRFQQYMDWDINYGKVVDRDGKVKHVDECIDVAYCRELVRQGKVAYPYPEEWAKAHHLANIQLMAERGRLRWGLWDGFGATKIAALE